MINFKRCAAFLAALTLPMTIIPQMVTAADSNMRVHCHGISKAFHTEFKAEELLAAHGISVEKLTAEIIDTLK